MILAPSSVTLIANNAAKPASTVGDDPWGDDTDDTYTETWTSHTSTLTAQDKAVGTFGPVAGVTACQPSVRLAMSREGNATLNRFSIGVYDSADVYLGLFDLPTGSVLPATDVIYQYDEWTFYDADNNPDPTSLYAAMASGITVVAEALSDFSFTPPEHWALRVYRFVLDVAAATTHAPAQRVYPREDSLRGGAPRVYPPPRTRQAGVRVTGYL